MKGISIMAGLFFALPCFGSVAPLPHCTVTAEVIEVKESAKSSQKLKLKVLEAKAEKPQLCDHIQPGKFIDVTTGHLALKAKDQIEARTGASSSMGPNGAVSFIGWMNVKVTNRKVELNSGESMQSGLNFY